MEENTNELNGTDQVNVENKENLSRTEVDVQTVDVQSETRDIQVQSNTEQDNTDKEDISNQNADEYLKNKGFNYDELQQEFMLTGDLSKETRAKLVEAGIPEDAINSHLSAFSIQAERAREEVASVVGSRDELESVIKWAGENLNKDEILAINSITDINVMKIIVRDLKNRMEDVEGITPKYIEGSASVNTDKNLFMSKAEMMKAINDPRYGADKAYEEEVTRKIAASREAGYLDL